MELKHSDPGITRPNALTRADLATAVRRATGLSQPESAAMVETVLGEISDAIVRGEDVKLSSFGAFVSREKGQRIGRNPKTGVEAEITPRRTLHFKASGILKARVNGNNSRRRKKHS